MGDEERYVEPTPAALKSADKDPPREFQDVAPHEVLREPADDDPPAEPMSPWNEIPVDVTPRRSVRSSLDEVGDEDPPSEPGGVTSIPHARIDPR